MHLRPEVVPTLSSESLLMPHFQFMSLLWHSWFLMEEQLLQKNKPALMDCFVCFFSRATQVLIKVTTDDRVKMYVFLNILAIFYGSIW